jgi:hypothetical protein
MSRWIDLLFYGDYGMRAGGPEGVLFGLLLAFIIGQVIAWIYMWTHKVLSYSQTFVASMVILPVLVALMMMLMSGSVVIAFGLLAVFAVVRFRNVLKDTRDTTFVLWGIVEGMAVGTERQSTAVISTIFIACILLYLRLSAFGSRHRYDVVLQLVWAGDANSGEVGLRPILRRHSSRVQLASSRRLPGEGVDLSYRLLLRDPTRSDELQAELEQVPEVERLSLFLREDESEV